MLKVHYQTDQEELLRACDGVMFQLFEDRFVKSAASDIFTKEALKEHAPDKDHFMMHLVAMGDSEAYGWNKNGDAFPKEALEKYAHTFVTNGCLFREHRNRDQQTQGIGTVKAAAYSPTMRRVEIVVHGHREKAAAEYEKAKAGEPLSYSMSCKIPYDICSICDNKATKQANYCSHLKHEMLQYNKDFKKYAYAINDKPTFFDISVVAKPADRIAHYLDYAFPNEDDREKAASLNHIITGTEWAEYEGVCIPDNSNNWDLEKLHVLEKLAQAEQYFAKAASGHTGRDPIGYFAADVAPRAFCDKMSDAAVEGLRVASPGKLVSALSKEAAVLPFPEFAAWVLGTPRSSVMQDATVKQAACMLPDIFSKLLSGAPGGMADMFDACNAPSTASGDIVQQFMDEATAKFNVKTQPTKARVIQIVTIKMASSETPLDLNAAFNSNYSDLAKSQALAEAYGIYKVASMQEVSRLHGSDIDELQYLLLAAQNRFIYC